MNRAELIRRGNIVTTKWSGEGNVGRYLGNGRFGALMSATGLNLSPEQQNDPCRNSSNFRYIGHWGRFQVVSRFTQQETSADFLMPLFGIYWEKEYKQITEYHQCHDLYDGVLSTEFHPKSGGSISVVSWFDAVKRNLAGIIIDAEEGEIPENRICLSVPTPFNPWPFLCQNECEQSVNAEQEDGEWKITISCEATVNHAKTEMYIRSNMAVEKHETGLWFSLKAGRNSLLISIGEIAGRDTPEESLLRTKEQNHSMWEQIGWLDYPDEQMQKVWVRSMAYLLTSYDADCEYIQPANSMGINGFRYNFVPDIGNIAPALSMLGRWDIVRHWVEKFAGEIENMRRYARYLWPEAEGIFPPWELNYGPIEGYHVPTVPMIFFYEAHNTGYMAKLALEAMEHSNDEEWNRKYAYPLIKECARFFFRFCHKEEDGLWHLTWHPCMGRDEAGGVNKDDYLCTLIAAKYSFKAAIRCGFDKNGEYKRILSEGLAFESLRSERGIFHTCRGADDFGKQKHPVQLEGIASFPTEPYALEEEMEAYRQRHDITMDAKKSKFHGWTLAQLLMVGSNLRKYEDWISDWNLLRPSNNTDEMWVQFYESCDVYKYAFYTATHGMILLSLIRNCVNDYWGKLEIGACLPRNACVRFGDIRTQLGVVVSGKIENGRATGWMRAGRDTVFEFQGREVKMECGEEKMFDFSI